MNEIQWLIDLVGENNLWLLEVFGVVFVTLLVAYIFNLALNRVKAKAALTQTLWDDALLKAIKRPVRGLIWLMGLSFAAELSGEVVDPVLLEITQTIRTVGIILLGAWFLVLFIRQAEANLMNPDYTNDKPMDTTTVMAIAKLLRVSVMITTVLVLLQTLGISVSGVLAFGGIGGLAVGFAAKDLLANFFGGLMVYMDRQFSVGEWIRSPDQNIEGVVEDIGWRLTRIRTFDKRPLYVPNATFTHISVENPSRMTNRRINETIGVRYDDAEKLPSIITQVKAMIQAHHDIDHSQTLIVNFNTFSASSLDFFIYTFTKTTDWVEYHSVKQDVLFKALKIIEQHGAEVAFPTSTLHVPYGVAIENRKETADHA